MPPDVVILADNLELDRRACELRRSGRPVKLSRIPMELLLLLVERRGELVTRDEIGERIWGKDVFVDQDNNINAAVRKLRQVLDDDSEHPKFVQTVTGRGYRFIAATPEVVSLAPAPKSMSDQVAPTEGLVGPGAIPIPGRPIAVRQIPGRRLVLPAVAVVLLIAAGVYFQWFRSHAHPQAAAGRVMLAVLPFENLTGDVTQDYFSDGLTEEMIAQLGNLDPRHLGVIARTSVMHYKGTTQKLDQIGSELGVQYVLEGSVRRDSEKVRITAQLIQVRDQTRVWARQYDHDLTNLLSLQAEIAQEVAEEIPLGLGDSKGATAAHQGPVDPQEYAAYDLYLKGRYFWNKRTEDGLQQAITCFQQAIVKDPNYARAYSGLADSYVLLSGYTLASQTESIPKARAAALKALELDEGLAEAHTSLALITENYDWDWKTAEKEYRRAIELNPNYATAHHWYAEFLLWRGRFDEALAESERARQLDPLSLIIAADHGAILYYSRQYDPAIAQFRAVLEMDPDFPRARLVVAAFVEKGQFEEALADIRKWDNKEPRPWTLAWRAYIYSRAGQQAQARRSLEKLQWLYQQHHYIGPDPLLWAYIGMGDSDAAFAWFEKAYAEHSNVLISLKVNPAYDRLRADPRFQELMRRVGLDQ
ncbi:MAG: winged helix-turn-helix domain-containing protein [Candidatus Sulfotelmatobacter sp.]